MVQNERIIRHELVVEAGRRMMMAARTAPKARGVDIIEIALVSERADLEKLSAVMCPLVSVHSRWSISPGGSVFSSKSVMR